MCAVLILSVFPLLAVNENTCKDPYKTYSCKSIKGAKRDYFCAKKKVSKNRIKTLCKKIKKK
jgi:hypothetical protein